MVTTGSRKNHINKIKSGMQCKQCWVYIIKIMHSVLCIQFFRRIESTVDTSAKRNWPTYHKKAPKQPQAICYRPIFMAFSHLHRIPFIHTTISVISAILHETLKFFNGFFHIFYHYSDGCHAFCLVPNSFANRSN